MNIKIIADNDSCVPKKAHESDACFDLASAESVNILPGERALVDCGFSMSLPEGFAAFLWPRSGLASRAGIHVGAGVIDEGYRGPVHALLFNHGSELLTISPGDRVAQMFVTEVPTFDIEVVDNFDNDTDRGEAGFGSTGT